MSSRSLFSHSLSCRIPSLKAKDRHSVRSVHLRVKLSSPLRSPLTRNLCNQGGNSLALTSRVRPCQKRKSGGNFTRLRAGLVWKQIFELTCQSGCQLGSTLDEAVRTPQERRLLIEAEAARHKSVCNQQRACLRPAPSDLDCWCSFSSPIWFV